MDEEKKSNLIRTDVNCTNCHKNFIAQLDFAVDGNHIINCPYCDHEHYREIKNGKVTDVRWNSQSPQIKVNRNSIWKSGDDSAVTTTAAYHIRELWLNKLDSGLT